MWKERQFRFYMRRPGRKGKGDREEGMGIAGIKGWEAPG